MSITPISDFVKAYIQRQPVRFHMPGHKGIGSLGCEALDITEIDGAGSLYAPGGVIAESEAVASRLFGMPTFYSAEGSSLAIRAMLLLAMQEVGGRGRPLVLAGRNAHQALVSAAALLDFDVEWLYPAGGTGWNGCPVGAVEVDAALERLDGRCRAVYLTSPDYLGNTLDIAAIAAVCRRRGALLLVDNAHGAYLKFLTPSRHPADLGADICCDSAHKTLPVLTGGAYLHIRPGLAVDEARVRHALALFGSSSPSWLILQSLDACNPYLETLPARMAAFLPKIARLKAALAARGYALIGDEPMKLTIRARAYGYTGDAIARALTAQGIHPEFHDPDFLTLMPAPTNTDAELKRLEDALLAIPQRDPLPDAAPPFHAPERALSIRKAALAPRETLPAAQCIGRILAAPAVSCPPCVPVAVCGERIDAQTVERLVYYGVKSCEVVRE